MRQVDRRLQRLVSEFRTAVASLGEVHATSYFDYEFGAYARLLLRPNYRLGSSLMTSREVLVVATLFHDLQTRTIAAVEESLAAFGGRAEPKIVIILHFDPRGETKLKHWGRERGLTVLALYAGDGVPSDLDLERSLCSELYSHDPFDLTGPVRDDTQFFGRPDIPDVARRLRRGQIRSLFGVRKIGKTSVLNRILREARTHHDAATVFADLSIDSLATLHAGPLMNSIGGAVVESLNTEDGYAATIPLREDVSLTDAGDTLLHSLRQVGRPLIMLLDEIDSVSPSSPISDHWIKEFNPLFRTLRYVYQESCRLDLNFSIVICGVSSKWFSVEEIDGSENAALALVPEDYLGPFEREQSVDMIRTLGRAAGLQFSRESAMRVAETCSDIPFWVRRAGSYIHSCYPQQGRPFVPDTRDIEQLCSEFVDVEGSTLAYNSVRHLFRVYPDVAPAAIACLNETSDAENQRFLSALGRYGILGEGRSISGPMMAAGIRMFADDQVSAVVPVAAAPITAQEANIRSEDQWEDLVAEVSRLRNELERKFRQFILNVLRMHCAEREDGRRPLDLILPAVPEQRRPALQGKSASAAMNELYWPDLSNIVRRQFRAFEPYFQDKGKFEQCAEIINDRPDAHAREMDEADLALQRRSIAWIRQRVEALD